MADILMYHGIDDAGGPTSVPPQVFADQMAALAASNRPVLSMSDWMATRQADAVVITFDDALTSFAETAWPVLQHHNLPVTVYVPTHKVGGAEDWPGGHRPARSILPWSALADLAAEGVSFGGHSRTHPALDSLEGPALTDEISGCKADLEDRLGHAAPHFAPPYGASSPAVRQVISQHWDSSVGVTLKQAGAGDDPYDLPRIEMLYFCDIARWQAHLAGRGQAYFHLRRGLRAVRQRLQG